MKVTVLGGSAAGGNTGAGCSGYLLQQGDASLVLDLGPGTVLELRKHIDIRRLGGVVVSHLHLDHILDVAALTFGLRYNPIPPDRTVPLFLPPGAEPLREAWTMAFDGPGKPDFLETAFEVHEYDPDEPLEIDGLRVSFAPTVHYVPCWAIRVDPVDGPPVGYTADTGPTADLASLFRGVSLLVAEATLVDDRGEPFETRGHLTAQEAGQLATDAGAETLLLTHMWEEFGFKRYRQQAAKSFSGRVELATPGLTIDVGLGTHPAQ